MLFPEHIRIPIAIIVLHCWDTRHTFGLTAKYFHGELKTLASSTNTVLKGGTFWVCDQQEVQDKAMELGWRSMQGHEDYTESAAS